MANASDTGLTQIGRILLLQRQKQLLTEIEQQSNRLKEIAIPSVNNWGEVAFWVALPGHEDECGVIQQTLRSLKVERQQISEELNTREFSESGEDLAKKKLDQRKQKSDRIDARNKKKADRALYLKAIATVNQSIAQLPKFEQALMEVADPSIQANLRRRLEGFAVDGLIPVTAIDRIFNAVGGSDLCKPLVVSRLRKLGLIDEGKPVDTDEFRRIASDRSLSTEQRREAINRLVTVFGLTESEAFEIYKRERDGIATERRQIAIKTPERHE